ncbi:ExbB/TolQ/MotA proton channel family protein [Acetobacter estunensis NRIC 0472]|uniref:Biopolymer transport protein ExbB n=1 Tax=Acetobacter estunensis TaxID=104097 RepID=A0A967EDA6_9PROT|nr:MotA/TolQ/ExbB proton channel family protein [Acetobacter estunensis]NHO53800.1 MotA/TolQ/ExbB proton channel family protein [Acetobacter estunensis]GBQ20018.1 ExbB/TolQ/MotA proton channel family protein [Acetobacter estunensis NRIC 0472]
MTRLFRRLPFSALGVPALAVLLATAAPVAVFAQETAPAAQTVPQSAPQPGTPVAGQETQVPATTPAPVAISPTGTETVVNPYGLGALWGNGDIVARTVLIIMLGMSLGSWYIMITKFFEQSRLFSASREAAKNFWTRPTLQEGASSLSGASPFRYIAETAIVAAEHHEGTMQESIDLSAWTSSQIQRAVDSVQSDLQSGLAFLGTVGSTSPFVGLFGTVWGIYHALTAIGIAGQASIDKVAGPVGESLIMTAIGLGTAVPAVLGYNLLVRRNKTSMDRVRNFAADLQSILIGGFRHGAVRQTVVVRPDNSPTTATTNDRVG